MLIPYGWGNKLKKDVPMGFMACGKCRGFAPYYLGRVVFRVHICYIPVFFKTKGYYVFCGNCEAGREISKEQYEMLKPAYKLFTNKKLLKQCYNDAVTLSQGMEPTDMNIQYVFDSLAKTYPIDGEILANQYKTMIADIIKCGVVPQNQ